MTDFRSIPSAVPLILPFACWMVLMFLLPATDWSYALRTLLTLVALGWSVRRLGIPQVRWGTALAWGVPAGLLVLFLWVWPERFDWYRRFLMYGYTDNAPVDASAWQWKAIRLFGSAFVISVAEELFFRKWLLRYAGFVWMLAIFALEHNRWFAGILAGAVYGLLTLRCGLASAIVAHAVTNLTLGLFVLVTGHWEFW